MGTVTTAVVAHHRRAQDDGYFSSRISSGTRALKRLTTTPFYTISRQLTPTPISEQGPKAFVKQKRDLRPLARLEQTSHSAMSCQPRARYQGERQARRGTNKIFDPCGTMVRARVNGLIPVDTPSVKPVFTRLNCRWTLLGGYKNPSVGHPFTRDASSTANKQWLKLRHVVHMIT